MSVKTYDADPATVRLAPGDAGDYVTKADYDAMLLRMTAASRVPLWRPMDTAPKDGTTILVYARGPEGQQSVYAVSWRLYDQTSVDTTEMRWCFPCSEELGSYPATLDDLYDGLGAAPLGWQPLPKTPRRAMKDEGNHPFIVAARRIACLASGGRGISVEEASDYIAGEVNGIWLGDLVVWQPIDTAPQDGTYVLVVEGRSRSDDSVMIASWGGSGPDSSGRMWFAEGIGWLSPTHWMPLPKPPTP